MAHSATPIATRWSREAAHRYCRQLARSHYENFTVGSWLLPQAKLRHVYAIYGFCRGVDDLGDEQAAAATLAAAGLAGPAASESAQRLALLDWWEGELDACYGGQPSHPVFVALQETIQTDDIPPEPFRKLIEANRIDQRQTRYPSYEHLLRYCEHSANPVGRLFLYLFGCRDAERQRLSDSVCTALQLANFWQDVRRDYHDKGRIYLPQNDMARFGYTEAELAQGAVTPAFRRLLEFECQRARELFRQGAPLIGLVDGQIKLDIALFTRGGLAVLDAIKRRDYDTLTARPRLSRGRKAALFLGAWLRWRLGLGFGLPE